MYELVILGLLTVLFVGVIFRVTDTILTKHPPWSVESEVLDRWASLFDLTRGYHENDAALKARLLLKVRLKINK